MYQMRTEIIIGVVVAIIVVVGGAIYWESTNGTPAVTHTASMQTQTPAGNTQKPANSTAPNTETGGQPSGAPKQ